MSTMKKFGRYLMFIILFWILSDILIYIGINTTYKDIERRGEVPNGIEITQMQATTVNGRIKLKVNDSSLNGKYLKIDLYSLRGVRLGTQYIEITKTKEIETYFKISDVKLYEISVVEEKGESTEGFMDTAMSALTVLGIVIKALAL